MRITVGQFNDSYPPVMDGVGNTVQNYAFWLNKNYGKCFVITPKFPKYRDQDEFKVIRYASLQVPFRPPYRLGMSSFDFQTKKLLSDIDFNILHVHSPFSSGHLALKLARKKRIPIIATFHSKFYDDFKQALKSDFLAKMAVKYVVNFFEKVDYVWTVNERTAATLRDYGYKGQIEIMPNGTDLESNIDFDENKIFMKENYQVNEDEFMFLFVGQHIWQKNIKLIVEALENVKKQNIKYKMYFVGEGYAKSELMEMVDKMNLSNEIHFVGKITNRELLKRFFARSDIFLFPSIYDNAPIVVREAAGLKTPSIVIKNSNAQEGIIDMVNGFTCENDVNSLANKIIQAVSNKEQLQTIGEKAQQTIARSWESIIDQVGRRYIEIIKEHHDKIHYTKEKR